MTQESTGHDIYVVTYFYVGSNGKTYDVEVSAGNPDQAKALVRANDECKIHILTCIKKFTPSGE